ncbi:MAG: ArsR/SmtB family transcription factor [Candidatus Methanofastidiosia archaeon]
MSEILPMLIIRDPEKIKLFLNEKRMQILKLLVYQEMSVDEIADILGDKRPIIYHHVSRLLKANLVKISREETEKNLIRKYYRAVALFYKIDFSLTEEKSDLLFDENFLLKSLDNLEKFGMMVSEENRSKFVKCFFEIERLKREIFFEVSKGIEIHRLSEAEITALNHVMLFRTKKDKGLKSLEQELLAFFEEVRE